MPNTQNLKPGFNHRKIMPECKCQDTGARAREHENLPVVQPKFIVVGFNGPTRPKWAQKRFCQPACCAGVNT